MKKGIGVRLGGIVSSAVFLGLAILGRGGWNAFFAVSALRTIVAVTLLLVIAGLFTEISLSSGTREDVANRWVLWVFSAVGLALAFFPAYTDRINFLTFGGDEVRWAGVALYIVGGVLRMYPVFVLKNRFSGLVAIQPGHQLVTSGIYSVMRNPSYLGLVVNALGWGLAFRSEVGVLLALVNVPPLVARMHSEERLLESEFGAEYRDYAARTKRLIPGIY
jgi:protein-S-isoprenylcysteine O-methyltransferase Ste14